MEQKSGCLVEFGCPCLPSHESYESFKSQLEMAMERFACVFVFPLFEGDAIDFATYQKFLAHMYATLAQKKESCEVVVIDPSVSLKRVCTEDPWKTEISHMSTTLNSLLGDSCSYEVIKGKLNSTVFGRDSSSSVVHVMPRFPHSVNGGTFDRLHNGHRILLGASVAVCSSSLTVGITSDLMIENSKKTLKELVQRYEERMKSVDRFLRRCQPDVERKLPAIDDPFGPSIVDEALECIIVSEETLSGGKAVNEKREAKGLSVLKILTVDCWDKSVDQSGSVENKISSTQLRKRAAQQKL